jgi:hypothetical protein
MLFVLTGCGSAATSPDLTTTNRANSGPSPASSNGGTLHKQVAGDPFVHPRAFNIKAELEFIKGKIAVGQETWASSFNELKTLATADKRTSPPTTENNQKTDLHKSYANTLAWYYTSEAQ